jgi:hypothetical protein
MNIPSVVLELIFVDIKTDQEFSYVYTTFSATVLQISRKSTQTDAFVLHFNVYQFTTQYYTN